RLGMAARPRLEAMGKDIALLAENGGGESPLRGIEGEDGQLLLRDQTILQASSKGRRGLRGNTPFGTPWPRLQRKFDLTVVPEKKASSTFFISKPDMGPQSRPRERAAIII